METPFGVGFEEAESIGVGSERPLPYWLRVGGGLALVGVLAWMLTRSPAEAGQVEPSLIPTTTAQPTTIQPAAGPRVTARSPAAASTTAVPLDHGYHMSVPEGPLRSRKPATVAGLAPGAPLLGEPADMSLFLGGRVLLEIDLDSGAVARYVADGDPVYADAEWLVLETDRASLVVVPRPDLAAQPRPLFSEASVQAVLPDSDGYVWVLTQLTDPILPPAETWTSVALSDGAQRSSIQRSDGLLFEGTPIVTGTVSGGVFVLEPDRQSYLRITDGSPIVATDRFVLIRHCESPVDCSTFWVDRATGDRVDRFVPPLEGIGTVKASPSGSFVTSQGPAGWSLWDIERGTLAETVPFNERGDLGAVFSSDGRFVAFATTQSANRGEVVIHDSLTGTRTLVALPAGTFSVSAMTFGPRR